MRQDVFPEGTADHKRLSLDLVHLSIEQITHDLAILGQENLFDALVGPIERTVCQAVVEKFDGNYVKASRALGIARMTLRKKLGVKRPWGKNKEKVNV